MNKRKNVRLDSPLPTPENDFDVALVEAVEKSGTGLENLRSIHTRRVRILSQPVSPLTERPRTIGWVLRRTFTFEV